MRFIWGHALVHVLSPVKASSDSLHIYLALVRAALLGVGRRGSFSYHMFKPTIWSICNLPIGFFKFYKVYSNTFDVCWRWILSHIRSGQSLEVSAPFLRVLFCLRCFRRGFRGCRQVFLIIPFTILIVCHVQYPRGYPLLYPGLQLSDHSSGGASVGSCLSPSSL